MSDDFEIITLKSGLKSLRSVEYQETFHPVTGPKLEARILHAQQQRLLERSQNTPQFVIWDIGFGAAANVLAAIEALEMSPADSKTEIEIHSFDRSTGPIRFALSHAQDLGYLVGHEARLERLLKQEVVQIGERISWKLHLGDFAEALKAGAPTPGAPHAILYDPYSPSGNPDMWTLEHFTRLWERLDAAVPCLLTNYTRSTAVRVALLLAGFYVGAGCEIGEKAETTIASNQLDLLERPLTARWLERVRISGNAAPLRTASYSKSGISDQDLKILQALPQFSAPS